MVSFDYSYSAASMDIHSSEEYELINGDYGVMVAYILVAETSVFTLTCLKCQEKPIYSFANRANGLSMSSTKLFFQC